MLHFQKQSSHTVLKGFCCGVHVMDVFIRDGLEDVLQNSKYSLYAVRDDAGTIVAMFVISEGMVVRDKEDYREIIDEGSPFAIFKEGRVIDKISYRTIEIEYLAVQEEYRNKGIGSTIIRQLCHLARNDSHHFLTVDAFHKENYSAIPFYEKNGFIPVEDYKAEQDTLRMFLYIK